MKNNNSILLTAYERFGSVGMDEYVEMYIDEELEFSDDMVWRYNDYYDDCIYSMDEFNDIMYGVEPSKVADMVVFGDFNPSDDYFRFNGYGNLESLDNYEVESEIMDDKNFLKWYIEQENLIDEDEAQETINKANELIEKGW